jgi:hypothetical protein
VFAFELIQLRVQRHVGTSFAAFRQRRSVPERRWQVEGISCCTAARAGLRRLARHLRFGAYSAAHFALSTRSGRGTMAVDLTAAEKAEFEAELARLKEEHRDFDFAIEALEQMVAGDQLQIQRLKKRKLALKDRITFLEDQLTPDIIA